MSENIVQYFRKLKRAGGLGKSSDIEWGLDESDIEWMLDELEKLQARIEKLEKENDELNNLLAQETYHYWDKGSADE